MKIKKYVIVAAITAGFLPHQYLRADAESDKVAVLKQRLNDYAKKQIDEMGIKKPIAFVYTNDQEFGKIVSANIALIETKEPLEAVLKEKQSEIGVIETRLREVKADVESYTRILATKQGELDTALKNKQGEVNSIIEGRKAEIDRLNRHVEEQTSAALSLDKQVAVKQSELARLNKKIMEIQKRIKVVNEIANTNDLDAVIGKDQDNAQKSEIITIDINGKK